MITACLLGDLTDPSKGYFWGFFAFGKSHRVIDRCLD
jgi:hypothetical protein